MGVLVLTIEQLRESLAAITAADHKAIYGSSARDYAEWLARQERESARGIWMGELTDAEVEEIIESQLTESASVREAYKRGWTRALEDEWAGVTVRGVPARSNAVPEEDR